MQPGLSISLLHPAALLSHLAGSAASISAMLGNLLSETVVDPNCPLDIVLYSDEVTPGNALSYANKRKTWAVYWSIMQLGPAILSDEDAWFVLTIIKADVVRDKIDGHMGAVMRIILEKGFFNEDTHDLSVAGMEVSLMDGSHHRLFFRIGAMLADEAALHAMLSCKGSSGLKVCCLCKNVFNKLESRHIVAGARGGAVHHTCADPALLKRTDLALIGSIMERLRTAKATMRKIEFEELQTTLGWIYNANTAIASARSRSFLDPPRTVMFDWQHCIFVNGCFNTHTALCVIALEAVGISPRLLNDYIDQFKFPRGLAPYGVFEKRRWLSSKNAGHVSFKLCFRPRNIRPFTCL